MSPRRTAFIASLAALAAGLTACGGGDSDDGSEEAAGDAPAVSIKAFQFAPDPLRAEVGQKITWTNEDATVHTVTTGPRKEPDGRLDGKLSASGGRFSASFDKPGTYRYFCSRHSGPGMEAQVVVE